MTYRTLLFDIVKESGNADGSSPDGVSLEMGLRLWLCDVTKNLPHLYSLCTEVDFYPLFLFFGQLLTTQLADLTIQLLLKVCDLIPREMKRINSEIFRWLIESTGLRDLLIMMV